ncbi:MAG: aspartate/glutamate racemase family protein [Pseudomonadota bacterium]
MTEPPCLGLIVLQSDETIEDDFRRLLPLSVRLHVTRVRSGAEVTPTTLSAMASDLTGAASLFPRAARFGAIGYGCTSGTAQIGAALVAALVREGASAKAVSNPLTALVAACGHLGLRRLGFLSPYVEAVSARLRAALSEAGIETPVFDSFDEPEEAAVARLSAAAILERGRRLAAQGGVEALFLSCTNLRTLDVIEPLEGETGLPVLSSNQVLAWHLARLAGLPPLASLPGTLGEASALSAATAR